MNLKHHITQEILILLRFGRFLRNMQHHIQVFKVLCMWGIWFTCRLQSIFLSENPVNFHFYILIRQQLKSYELLFCNLQNFCVIQMIYLDCEQLVMENYSFFEKFRFHQSSIPAYLCTYLTSHCVLSIIMKHRT